MALRICLVTPHAWSVPHDTNEHVAGLADALRDRGHHVVVLAPSLRSKELLAGRRALQEGRLDGVVALARAVPVSPRSAVGIPVGVRANVATALRRGDFDVVHGFDPGVAGLSYVALLEAETTTVATFVDPERLGYPPRRNQRDRLLARIDTLLAVGRRDGGSSAGAVPRRVRDRPRRRRPRPLRTAHQGAAGRGRELGREPPRRSRRAPRSADDRRLGSCPAADGALAARPSIPLALRDRVHVRTALTVKARAEVLRGAAIVVPSPDGLRRLRAEAAAAGCAVVEPPGLAGQPELAAAALLRLTEDPGRARARRRRPSGADRGGGLRCRRGARRAPLRGGTAPSSTRPAATRPSPSPTATGSWSTSTCTRTTRTTARSSPPRSSPMQRPRSSARSR